MNPARRILSTRRGYQLVRLLGVLMALLIISSTALAAGPLTGTFAGIDAPHGQQVTFTRPDNRVVTDWTGVLKLQLDKNVKGDRQGPMALVFCIQLYVVVGRPRQIDTYVSAGPVTDLQGGGPIRYLLFKYPAASVTTGAEGAARQLAIWHFSDLLDLTTVQDAAIRARAIMLADEAAQAQVPTTNTSIVSITIEPASATVPQGQPVIYTVRATPPDAAQTVDIAVDGTAMLDNGQQQATYPLSQGVASFSVVNQAVGTSSIKATLPYLLDAGTVFESDKTPKTQRLVLGDGVTLSATAQVQTSWQPAAPTATPGVATSTPTETPGGAGDTPTATPGGAGNTPTSTVVEATSTPPTKTPIGAPEATKTGTPNQPKHATNTPGHSTDSTPTPETDVTPGSTEQPATTPSATSDTPTLAPGAAESTPIPSAGAQAPNSTRPRSLPVTGGLVDQLGSAVLLLAVLLLAGGALMRRRGAQRKND